MLDRPIQMVDLRSQYERLRDEIEPAVRAVMEGCAFINGSQVKAFADRLADYLGVPYVIPCGNGTDALRISLMALGLRPGEEVIVPAFTYIAAAEVALDLGLVPVLVDVDPRTFNMDPSRIVEAISGKTRAIIPVHLFGQSCDMAPILSVAEAYGLYVIEDNAQSLGASYTFPDGKVKKAGTMGHIGTTSFFPSKPLACYGDGGAIFTADERLAERLRMIACHGQRVKYHHQLVGCNSRLDTLQAAVLDVKLRHLEAFTEARQRVAARYDEAFRGMKAFHIPARSAFSTHIYHQYTIRWEEENRRDQAQAMLKAMGIPSMVYYPLPLQDQEVMRGRCRVVGRLEVASRLSRTVLSLPIHTEMKEEEVEYILTSIKRGF